MKTGVFYGSTTGNTENAAVQICSLIAGSYMTSITDAVRADLEACDLLVLGTSTWGMGDLQDDWSDNLESLRAANLQGKKVAFFGLGDQAGYPDTFVDGMRELYDAAVEAGATVIGKCSDDGYDYVDSAAVEDGQFLGLVLDQENQPELTEERIQTWVDQLLREAG